MQTAYLTAPESTPVPTFELMLARNIADAEQALARGRVVWEQARRRVAALEVVVDHWRFLAREHRYCQDGARRRVSA
jgi:hypothetical protein